MLLLATIARRKSVPPSGGQAALPRDFEALYNQQFTFVWRSLRGLGVSTAEVDDALQEVFLVAYRRLDEFEQKNSIRGWLYAISRRVASNYRRRERRKGGLAVFEDGRTPGEQAGPQRRAEVREALAIVEAFADTLDEERRSIFVMAELEQMSVPEISEILNINHNTIYSRLKVIRSRFEKMVRKTLGRTSSVQHG